MKLAEILSEVKFSEVDWESPEHATGPIDTEDYYIGGWVNSQTGDFRNQHTDPGVNHHIEFIINDPKTFGVRREEIPHIDAIEENPWDVPMNLWTELEMFMDRMLLKVPWVRVFIGHGTFNERELNFEGSTSSMKRLLQSGLIHKLMKKFGAQHLVVDLKDTKKSHAFSIPQHMGEFARWLDNPIQEVLDPGVMADRLDKLNKSKPESTRALIRMLRKKDARRIKKTPKNTDQGSPDDQFDRMQAAGSFKNWSVDQNVWR